MRARPPLMQRRCAPLRRRGEHSDGIVSFVLTDDAPLPWDAFARGMERLIACVEAISCA